MLAMAGALASISSAEDHRLDLAAVITKTDAQTALGEPVKIRRRGARGRGRTLFPLQLLQREPGKSLVLRIRQASPGQLEPKKQLEEMSAGNAKFKTITWSR